MKTRKKMLFMSMLGVFLFTLGCMYLLFIDKSLSDSLIDKFFNYCVWVVVGSGVCGVVSKRNDRIKELHKTSPNDEECLQDTTVNDDTVDNGEEYLQDDTTVDIDEEIMHGDEI